MVNYPSIDCLSTVNQASDRAERLSRESNLTIMCIYAETSLSTSRATSLLLTSESLGERNLIYQHPYLNLKYLSAFLDVSLPSG